MTTPPVTVFIQCLVDGFFPGVAEAMVSVLNRLEVDVVIPPQQTCCGQPVFNAGYHRQARRAARHFIRVFEHAAQIVCPSGSCVHMVRHHYPALFRDDPRWHERAVAIASRTFEFSEYLVDALGVEDVGACFEGRLTYHESCQLAFGLGVRRQPRRLIRNLRGAEFVEMEAADRCCGFGGLFAVKYPAVSAAMVDEKVSAIAATGAEAVIGCDMGCLMNIGGRLSRFGLPIRTLHLAQVLAGTP